MNTAEWFKDKLESFKGDFEFRLEKLILRLTDRLSERMKQKKINRTNLAALLQVSRPAVTKILDGNSNFTLRKLLSLSDALDLELEIDFKEKDVVESAVPAHKSYPRALEAYEKERDYASILITSGSTETTLINEASASITLFPPYDEKSNLDEAVNA